MWDGEIPHNAYVHVQGQDVAYCLTSRVLLGFMIYVEITLIPIQVVHS